MDVFVSLANRWCVEFFPMVDYELLRQALSPCVLQLKHAKTVAEEAKAYIHAINLVCGFAISGGFVSEVTIIEPGDLCKTGINMDTVDEGFINLQSLVDTSSLANAFGSLKCKLLNLFMDVRSREVLVRNLWDASYNDYPVFVGAHIVYYGPKQYLTFQELEGMLVHYVGDDNVDASLLRARKYAKDLRL